MAIQLTSIKDSVLEVLQNSTIDGNVVKLPPMRLEANHYKQVNAALTAIGGKWNTKAQGHVFESPEAANRLLELTELGLLIDPKVNGYFPTPPAIVERIMDEAAIRVDMTILEPSAGRGAIALAAAQYTGYRSSVCVCELLPGNLDELEALGFTIIGDDFLTMRPSAWMPFDRVVMNPPFGSNQYADHILLAWQFVKPGGRLVSVAPSGVTFRNDSKPRRLREAIADVGGTIEALPEGSFKAAGTGINSVLITMDKPLP